MLHTNVVALVFNLTCMPIVSFIYSYAIVIEETKAYMVQLLFNQNYPDDLVYMFLLYYNGRLWSKFQVSTETCAILVPHKIKQKISYLKIAANSLGKKVPASCHTHSLSGIIGLYLPAI